MYPFFFFCRFIWCHVQGSIDTNQYPSFPLVFYSEFLVSLFCLDFDTFWVNFCLRYKVSIQLHSFLHLDIQFSHSHFLKGPMFSHKWCVDLVESGDPVYTKGSVSGPSFLFCRSICLSLRQYILFDCCSCVICFEMRTCETSHFMLLFKIFWIAQGFLEILYEF